MGKEWLNWVGNGKTRLMRKRSEEAEETAAGCMCAVFQMFNLHYFPFALQPNQPSTNVVLFQDEFSQTHVLKGVEAPRNSLDLVEPTSSSSSTHILEDYLNMQVGIQIKTSCEDFSSSSICSNSPSTKTPNLVARLMGLDVLPESTSPSLSSSSLTFHATSNTSKRIISKHDCSGTLSLPETPRISSCSRRSDVEHHRLSLQLHKENFLVDEIELSGFVTQCERSCDKDKYSKGQILKQVKESVRRRFGLDITNANIIKPKEEQRKDIKLVVDEKKPSSFSDKIKVKEVHQEKIKKKKKSVVLETSKSHVRKPPQASDDDAVRSKKEEPFIHSMMTNKGINIVLDKKAKKTPLSNDLVNICFPANQQFDKQESSQAFHDSPTKKRSKQLSSHQYLYPQQQEVTPTFPNFEEKKTQDSKQNHYIQTILKHTGIEKNKLYSSSSISYPPVQLLPLPLDLSLFHFLEVFDHNTPEPRCQRKLVFDLVDELLVEIFEHDRKIKGSDLVETLCKKVGSFPSANCQVIEDIDALIYEDFRRYNKMGKWDARAFQEGDGESMVMVMDIEDYIVDLLVHETVAIVALMDVDMVRQHCVRWLY